MVVDIFRDVIYSSILHSFIADTITTNFALTDIESLFISLIGSIAMLDSRIDIKLETGSSVLPNWQFS